MQNWQRKKDVFIDTSALAALIDQKDYNHTKSKSIFTTLHKSGYKFTLTNFVIAETHVLLLRRIGIVTAQKWLSSAYNSNFNIIRPHKEEELEAVAEIKKYADKEFSFTDMLSFLTMIKLQIEHYFAFDKHFKQFGKFADIRTIIYN